MSMTKNKKKDTTLRVALKGCVLDDVCLTVTLKRDVQSFNTS